MISPTKSPGKSRGKRRMSVDDATAVVVSKLHAAMDKLDTLWNKVSLDQGARELRIQAAHEHFFSLLDDIVESEEEMVKGVETDIKSALTMNNSIREELHEPEFRVKDYKPLSVALLKALRKDLEKLKVLKDRKMAKQLSVYDELAQICNNLDEEVPVFEGVEDRILSPEIVESIIELKKEKKKLLEQRLQELVLLQNKANKMNQVVKNISLEEFEKELLSLDFQSKHRVPLSETYISQFENLLQKFENEYQKWLETIEFEYAEIYEELKELSQKCYAREVIDAYDAEFLPENHTDDDLNKMRVDLERLRERYETGKPIYDKFYEWFNTFESLEALEEEMKTEAYRKNRGGCLNRALKQQKILKIKLNKVLEELQVQSENSPSVTLNGMPAFDFVQDLISKKGAEKENEKVVKKKTREEQLKMEQRFGSSYSPQKVQSPRKRLQTPQTVGVIRAKKRRSSSVSAIEPISKTPGPMSSSPKPTYITPSRTPSRLIAPKNFRSARR
ncbi:unnamed protein product [Bursaphelenchus xylophilus]|uniref:(pine wood nematode) hypothetical protein n=1 Tax=Bursaphelenchus xylophilus TaxID=6326 RepID=A0A1I7RQX5_BURXY|nr:unnamed protein product [Bursaphelenchus xylophilus]CAG9130731.1 unnamed protein product [Bursaphelenchus xylophilus]